MRDILKKFCGLIALWCIAVVCWMGVTSLVALGTVIAAPSEQDARSTILGDVLIFAFFCGDYYGNLYHYLVTCSAVLPLRTCVREIFVRSACLLWFPALMTLLPLVVRLYSGFHGGLPGTYLLSAMIAAWLVSLTHSARQRLIVEDDIVVTSSFGGRPTRGETGRLRR